MLVQVKSAGVQYFTLEEGTQSVLAAPFTLKQKKVESVVRRSALMGEVVDIPDDQAEELKKLGMVQDPGEELLANQEGRAPQRTFFSVPMPGDEIAHDVVNSLGDPRPAAQVAAEVASIQQKLDEDLASDEEEDEELDVAEASVEDLTAWIENESPTVEDVVNAAGEDPEAASKLIEAEKAAKGDKARKTVIDQLEAIAGEQD